MSTASYDGPALHEPATYAHGFPYEVFRELRDSNPVSHHDHPGWERGYWAVAEPTTTEDEEKLAGADKPREPSGEEDVDYGKLEEMTAKADGKEHASVEPETEGYE